MLLHTSCVVLVIWTESNLSFVSCRNVYINFPQSCQISWTLRGWVLNVCSLALLRLRFCHGSYQLHYVAVNNVARVCLIGHHSWHFILICAHCWRFVSVSLLGSDRDHAEVSENQAADLCQRVSEAVPVCCLFSFSILTLHFLFGFYSHSWAMIEETRSETNCVAASDDGH